MAFRYSNVEYTEMVRTLARCEDNVELACRVFNKRHGTRVILPRLTGDTYLQFLQETLPQLLEDVPLSLLRDVFYQHDGAPAHFTWNVRRHLDAEYDPRWIGRGGPVQWPPRSADLTPLDFYL